MFLIALFGFVAIASGLPAQQILGPAATLTAIPATNHILILTPQAQVQLEPSLKYAQPIVQHLAPVARIDSPLDQTVVYVPNDNIINAAVHQGKQLETSNITNVINQFVNAGQTVQAELQALQSQLSQGLEGIIQPGQKVEGSAAVPLDAPKPVAQLSETPRQDSGRFYSVPAGIPQFYSNIEVIHTPLNPLFAIQPIQTIRARSVVHAEDKPNANVAALQGNTEHLNLAKKTEEGGSEPKSQGNENQNQARNTENAELATVQASSSQADNFDDKSLKVQKENEPAPSNSQFGKLLGSIEKRIASPEAPLESNLKDAKVAESKEPGSQGVSIAEALPAGLAISGEGGLAQARPIASAITGKDGISYSAPSGTAISGTSDNEKASKSS